MFLSCFKKFLFIHKIILICVVFCLGASNLVQAQIKPLTISGEGYHRNRRSGLRTATFMTGKNHVGITLADYNTGAFVRPFRYV